MDLTEAIVLPYLAYQTAYLKAHYAAYFYAAVLSNEAHDATKILSLIHISEPTRPY